MLPRRNSTLNKDRRTRVAAQELLDLPYNCIGLLKAVATTSGSIQSKIGTGFLVSHFLVLTSASLLTRQTKNYQVESLIPASFTLADRSGPNREYKVDKHKISPKYFQILKEIYNLNRNLEKESNSATKKNISQQILVLNQERCRHDFALLKLSRTARRAEVLKLTCKMDTPSFLTVTGYSSSSKDGAVLMSHSNKIVQIKNGVIYYDIEAKEEQIGSPVYLKDQGNKVLGMNCGFDAKRQLNCAAILSYDFLGTLEEWSIELKAPFPFQDMYKKQSTNSKKQIIQNQACFGKDRRKQVNPGEVGQFPFNCIGLLDGKNRMDEIITGTGFLISDCLVLTSAHTIYEIANKNKFDILPVTFEMYGFESPIKITDYRMHPKFIDLRNQKDNLERIVEELQEAEDKIQRDQLNRQIQALTRQQYQYDFSMLRISEKIALNQYFQIHPDFDDSLEPLLTLTGYDTFRNPYKFMTHSGVIYDIRKGAIFYDIDTMGGQSGSPVYLKDNPRKLVGIHKAASNEDRLNFSAMITKEMVEVLKMWSVEMEPYFRVIPKSK